MLILDTAGQLALKRGSDALAGVPFGSEWFFAAGASWGVMTGLACYALSFLLWLLILNRTALSFAFPLTALLQLTVFAAAVVVLGEPVDALRSGGCALIVLGVWLLGGDEA